MACAFNFYLLYYVHDMLIILTIVLTVSVVCETIFPIKCPLKLTYAYVNLCSIISEINCNLFNSSGLTVFQLKSKSPLYNKWILRFFVEIEFVKSQSHFIKIVNFIDFDKVRNHRNDFLGSLKLEAKFHYESIYTVIVNKQ